MRLRRPAPSWRGRSRTTALLAAVVGLALSCLLAGCSDPGDGFVTRSGRSLMLDGRPFRFVGFNLYDAAASDLYSCLPSTRLSDSQLAATLRYAHDEAGATVLRFWAYQTYTAGGTDFTGTDRLLAAARKAGLRVLPVLEDGPGYCTTGQNGSAKYAVPGDTWYSAGYRQPYGSASVSYRDYVQRIVRHYRDNPTILGWMMMNEAETSARMPDGRSALVGFAQDVGGLITSIDHRHLVTLGSQSNGAPGASGRDFTDLYRLPVLDFAEVHDWAEHGSDTEPLPGATGSALPDPSSPLCRTTTAPLACSFAISRQLGKPIVVGESGILARDEAARARRARLLTAKMDAAFAAGASGYLVWQLNTAVQEGYDVLPAAHDPLVPAMAAVARRLGHPAADR